MAYKELTVNKLTREDLWSLEEYAEQRSTFRSEVLAHKRYRRVALGKNAHLYFEDRTTIKYQIQEMLRIEKIFDKAGIEEELEAYNPLIPDGQNWKATFMLEYEEAEQRQVAVRNLIDIESRVWVQIGDSEKVYPIADEDLERTAQEKTSTVHFLRFELTPGMISAAKKGAGVKVGIDHAKYRCEGVMLESGVRDSLVNDLDEVSIN